jgi:hypothetical protein
MMSEIAFHEKAGRSQGNCGFIFVLRAFLAIGRCRHASIRTLEERFVRSVQSGHSRFSGAAICLAPCGSTPCANCWASLQKSASMRQKVLARKSAPGLRFFAVDAFSIPVNFDSGAHARADDRILRAVGGKTT